ncbi:MAG: hypothetical protein RLZ98_2595 [Pseudomonadota bacterium]|jgi:putative ABC transport system permease protein
MHTLDKKLLRDLKRMWGQALAISLVVAAGVTTLVTGVGTHQSLVETREAYYERYRFADLFAEAKRAPTYLIDEIARIPGVAGVEARVKGYAILDLPAFEKPANALVVSLPAHGEAALNALYVREGRLPDPLRSDEVAISAAFAKAHDFHSGSTFSAILNGRKKVLTVVGVMLSPEFIYALGPGDVMPDNARFGIVWMNLGAAEAAFGMKRAFNDISLGLIRGANAEDVLQRLDAILAPHGGTGGHQRKDQLSHAFIDAELSQLRTLSTIVPPIFMTVAAFLINMALSRLIVLERQQIGLLKALGYSTFVVAGHYLKLAGAICLVGIAVGYVVGVWLGIEITRLYGAIFQFPFLVFQNPPGVFLLASLSAIIAAVGGALWALLRVITLPPAVAMAPPVPVSYRHRGIPMPLVWLREWVETSVRVSQPTLMIVRHILRFPLRTLLTTLGIASSGALLVMSFSVDDAIGEMTNVTFQQADRSDATLYFNEILPLSAREAVARLPGVLQEESFRELHVALRKGSRTKRIWLRGLRQEPSLVRVLDRDLEPVPVPGIGIAVSEKLASLLGVGIGDNLEISALDGRRRTFDLQVTQITQGFIGLQAFVQLEALNRLVGDGLVMNASAITVDANSWSDLYRALKETPVVASVALLKSSMRSFDETIRGHVAIMTRIYVALAFIITFGVVYNASRIQLSEHARELASLRVLGFTKAEVSYILLGQTAVALAAAIPLSWIFGYGFTWYLLTSFETELYRVPIVVDRSTYAYTTLTIVAAAITSALIVRRRVESLDMIAVLKTRE